MDELLFVVHVLCFVFLAPVFICVKKVVAACLSGGVTVFQTSTPSGGTGSGARSWSSVTVGGSTQGRSSRRLLHLYSAHIPWRHLNVGLVVD